MESSEYIDLLSNWGLQLYTQRFLDEGITDESFQLLDDETLAHIIDKAGPRLIFKRKFKEHLTVSEGLNNEAEVYSVSSPQSATTSTCTTWTVLSEPHSCSIPISIDQLKENLDETDEDILSVLDNTPKKLKKSSVFLTNNGLENLLSTSTDGRIVLLNRYKLNNDLRQKLCKIIISDLLCSNSQKEITKDTFVQASEEITDLFPCEQKESYYVPYSSDKTSGLRMAARGKLWSRYINVKAALRVANQHMSTNKKELNNSETCNQLDNIEAEKDLLFLKTGTEPQARVFEAWEKSFDLRYKLYFRDSKVDNLYEIFPSLQAIYGLELLEMDFNRMYPKNIDAIYQTWSKVIEAIIKEAKERKINLPDYKDTATQAVLILPFLFNPITLKKNSKDQTKNWRPTRSEIQFSFFFSAKDIDELEEVVARRQLQLDKVNLPMQPFGVVLNFDEYIIVSSEVRYKCESCVRAVELLYKTFHALNLEYPSECKHIWHFIQEMVFTMPVTNKSTSTSSVISDIKYHINT